MVVYIHRILQVHHINDFLDYLLFYLEFLWEKIKNKYKKTTDNEHIFNYFYRNNKYFRIKNIFAKNRKNKDYKLSLDTINDFRLFEEIYKNKKYNFLLKANIVIKEYRSLKGLK